MAHAKACNGLHYSHLLSLFLKSLTGEWLDSLQQQTMIPLYQAFSQTQVLTPQSEIPHTSR